MRSKLLLFIFLMLTVFCIRLVPHVPNFTPIITISFYLPILTGVSFLPSLILGFILADMILGFHETLLFTWGTIILIGLLSKKFSSTIQFRILGVLVSSVLFYLITNFGVWLTQSHGLNLSIFDTYLFAIPFFKNTLISTIVYSLTLEIIYKLFNKKKFKLN